MEFFQIVSRGQARNFMNFLFQNIRDKFSKFKKDQSGVVALIYGPMTLMLLIAAGIAIDYSRSYLVQREISRALDAAVLAAGSLAITDETEMKALAKKYFDANISENTKQKYNPQINTVVGTDTLTVTSSATVPTFLMYLAGHENVEVGARAVAGRTLVNLEVALVLDNTGSMSGSKLSSLKSAAKKLVETLYTPTGSENYVKFSLIPFTGAVNIGTGNENVSWFDKNGLSTAAQEDYGSSFTYWSDNQYDGMTAFEALNHFNVNWNGCVRARIGSAVNENGDTVDLDLWDVEADASDPNTLFAPHLRPLKDYYDTTWWGAQVKPSDSDIRSWLNNYNGSCPQRSILPLTNTKSTIDTNIESMIANGGTSVPIGLIWGWRSLSSHAPYTEGVPYGTDNTRKVIVILTDGQNDHGYYTSNKMGGYYSAYGMPYQQHLGTGWLGNELDDKLETICSNVKSKGILVYSITFELNDTNTQNLMRNCATRNDMYFNSPDGSSLQDAFDEIATGLQKLQLKQ